MAWKYHCSTNKIERLKSAMEHQDFRTAQLIRKLEEANQTATRALEQLHSKEEDRLNANECHELVTCMVCAHHVEKNASTFCRKRHAICIECIDSQCKVKLQCQARVTPMNCFAQVDGGCDAELSDLSLAHSCWGRKYMIELAHIASINRITDMIDTVPIDLLTLRLKFMRADGTYRAFACPHCKFGPIEVMQCDDLVEHHGRRGIDNSCPQCGTLTTDASKLLQWNGM